MYALVLAIVITVAACEGCGGAKVVRETVVDCVESHRAEVDDLLNSLEPLVYGRAPDWGEVARLGITAGREVGGCAVARLVDAWLKDRTRPPQRGIPPAASVREAVASANRPGDEEARATLEHVRAAFGGPQYRTESGDL